MQCVKRSSKKIKKGSQLAAKKEESGGIFLTCRRANTRAQGGTNSPCSALSLNKKGTFCYVPASLI